MITASTVTCPDDDATYKVAYVRRENGDIICNCHGCGSICDWISETFEWEHR